MEALQIMPVMAQRRNCNLGEFAEDATVVEGRLYNSSIRQRQRGYTVARLVH